MVCLRNYVKIPCIKEIMMMMMMMMMMIIIIIIIIIIVITFQQGLYNMYLKQTTFIGYTVLHQFCSYSI